MIKEAFVSFEVAKLLKEKGFHEPCIATYNSTTKKFHVEELYLDWSTQWESYISVPTHQMAMAWLREEKNIIVNVWYNGVDWSAEYYNNEDENFYLITDYSCNSYEDAVEVALKYCLENLI